MPDPHTIHGTTIAPGERVRLELPVARLPTQTPVSLPLEVIRGKQDGNRLWLSSAIHGDELNGMEIISRVSDRIREKRIKGQLILVPVVNLFGFIQGTRYLPDGRDLNRSFPGSPKGSLASRLANLFLSEVVGRCTHGIDLHTAGGHRVNLPQVRGNLENPQIRAMARVFGANIMIHGEAPGGSLRHAVGKLDTPILVYEAGETHRFNEDAIEVGVRGVLRVMRHLGMIPGRPGDGKTKSLIAHERTWVRARRSGVLRLRVKLGQRVTKNQSLGTIHDTFGEHKNDIRAPEAGLVIGLTNHPLVSLGDAMVHIAKNLEQAQ